MTPQPMRILMLTWHYPPAVGGSERMAQRLVDALALRGHRIEIWTARRTDAPATESPAPDVRIRRFLHGVPLGPLFGATAFLQATWSLWRARRRFDVIHSHQATWGALGGVLARLAGGRPILVMVASSGPLNDVTVMKHRKGGATLVRLLQRADQFIALCRSAREEMGNCGIPAEKVRIVHNGLDLAAFRNREEIGRDGEKGPGPSEESAEPDAAVSSLRVAGGSGAGNGKREMEPLIGYVGRLHPIKGVDLLLQAFAEVAREHSRARLVIVGDGQARPDLEALARKLGLVISDSPKSPPAEAQVIFAGVHTDPRPFYRQADVVVLPSRTEGMSNVMIEAMASARPIVATAVGGNCDLLDPEDRRAAKPTGPDADVFFGANGILVPPETPKALAKGILAILSDNTRARRMAESARRYAQAHCSIEAVADQYESIYRELAATVDRKATTVE